MLLLSPRILLVCLAGLPLAGCAKGMGGPIYEGMDGSINGNDGGDDDGGGTGGDTNGGVNGTPQCSAAAGTCAVPNLITTWTPATDASGTSTAVVQGDTSMQCSVLSSACAPSMGPENVHSLMMPIAASKLSFVLQAGANPVAAEWPATLYVTTAPAVCGDAALPIGCQATLTGQTWVPLNVQMPLALGQPVFVYVDGADLTGKGAYTLTITATP